MIWFSLVVGQIRP